jgi:hypothetical protein
MEFKNIDKTLAATLSAIAQKNIERPMEPGVDYIPASGKVLSEQDLLYGVEAVLDGWLTGGRFNTEFETKLAKMLGSKRVLTVNSGSSANLLAFATLTSPKLGERALKPGDEVITVASGFPTTVNPILQFQCIPVFIDVTVPGYNANIAIATFSHNLSFPFISPFNSFTGAIYLDDAELMNNDYGVIISRKSVTPIEDKSFILQSEISNGIGGVRMRSVNSFRIEETNIMNMSEYGISATASDVTI